MSETNKIIVAAIIGLIIGFALGWTVFATGDGAERDGEVMGNDTLISDEGTLSGSTETSTTGDGATTVMSNGDELIEVKDQEAGSTVFITRAVLAEPGWVAIHESQNGRRVAILGARRFDAGAHQGDVRLLRQTVAGETYEAVLWRDNGDRIFDQDVDTIVVDATGTPIQFSFEAF